MWNRARVSELEKQGINRVQAMDVIEPSQMMGQTQQGRNYSLSPRPPLVRRIEDLGCVHDTMHARINRLIWWWNNIFNIWRKFRILASRVSKSNIAIKLALRHIGPLLFHSRAICIEECTRDAQQAMSVPLKSSKLQLVFVYLDNIVVLPCTPDEHIDYVWQTLTLLYDPCLKLELNKCKSFTNLIDYLGQVISPRPPNYRHQRLCTYVI